MTIDERVCPECGKPFTEHRQNEYGLWCSVAEQPTSKPSVALIGEDENTFVYDELELDEVVCSREGDIIFIEDPLNDLETYTLTLQDAERLRLWLEKVLA